MQNLQNQRKWIPTGIPLEAQIRKNLAKMSPGQQHKKNFRKIAKMMQKRKPIICKNKDFALKVLHF
jgi:hypothetical protein